MKKLKKMLATACVGLSLGATAVVFMAPVEGGAGFRGYCNHTAVQASGGAASNGHNC